MSWHTLPKDDAWKQVHLAYLVDIGRRLWFRCNKCGHDVVEKPDAFSARHQIEPIMPLLLIARRLRCSRCGARKAHAWPEPYAGKR